MSQSPEDGGREAAQAAWNGESVRSLSVGLLRSNRPLLRDSPFYLGTLGCEGSDENTRFCTAYNATIEELLLLHGVPAWAPAARRPDRNEVLELLAAQGRPMSELALEHPPYEYRLFHSLRDRWTQGKAGELRLWARNREKGVLVVGGDWSVEVGRVDVLDVKERQWMASYEYLRKHVSQLPWDGLKA